MTKVTDLQELEALNASDLVHVVDVSNTTDDVAGSSFKVRLQTIADFVIGLFSASDVPVTPAGTITSTTVQAALEELDQDIQALDAGSGVTDHGALNGLTDDDHPQYHNDARGDARYSQLGHGHDISDVSGLQTALDGKAPALGTDDNYVTDAEKAALHSHSNKTTLDAIQEALTTALKTAYDTASSWVTTNGAAVLSHLSNTSNPHSVTKAQVGLSNVDNTSDANKPISTATQTALDNKADVNHTHLAADITDLTGLLNAKADLSHTHSLADLLQDGATIDQIIRWNGSQWIPSDETAGGGGYTSSTETANATLTATSGENIVDVDATAGAVTLTLPTAVGNAAKFTFTKTDSSENYVTIDADGSETINGEVTQIIQYQYTSFSIISNGTEWRII